jgi:Zn-dependent protease
LDSGNLLRLFLESLVILNAALAVFNLIPISPLDGSHLLESIVGPDNQVVRFLKAAGPFVLIAVIFFPGNPISSFIFGGISLILHILGLGRLL